MIRLIILPIITSNITSITFTYRSHSDLVGASHAGVTLTITFKSSLETFALFAALCTITLGKSLSATLRPLLNSLSQAYFFVCGEIVHTVQRMGAQIKLISAVRSFQDSCTDCYTVHVISFLSRITPMMFRGSPLPRSTKGIGITTVSRVSSNLLKTTPFQHAFCLSYLSISCSLTVELNVVMPYLDSGFLRRMSR